VVDDREVVDALRVRDPDRAEAMMRRHLHRAMREYLDDNDGALSTDRE
jgi:DNA-binding GntR family transcriptional regulator